jgi:2-methylcitrate dehydratase PrpD
MEETARGSAEPQAPQPGRWEAVVERALARDWASEPDEVRERARLVIADSLCATLAGGRKAEVRRLVEVLQEDGGGEGAATALVPGAPRLAPEQAAFVNGVAGTWIDVDEAADAGVHAGSHVLAAVLAVGQLRRVSGTRLVHAFLAGYEAVAALYRAYPTPYPVHPHAGLTAVGAAAAAASLTDADPLEAARIASTLPMTVTWDACFEGATTRHAFAGSAAATAVRAVQMARAGFTGSHGAVDTLFGLLARADQRENRAGEAGPPSAEILRGSFKLNGSCLTSHAAVDAARTLAPDGAGADAIASVLVETTETVAEKTGRQPQPNDLSAGFSVQYAVAAALRRGEGLLAIEWDAETAALAQRTEVRVDDGFPGGEHDTPARVTVTYADGTARTARRDHARGHFSAPPSVETLRAKAAALLGDAQSFDAALAIPDLEDVRELPGF